MESQPPPAFAAQRGLGSCLAVSQSSSSGEQALTRELSPRGDPRDTGLITILG